jgi:hypothetical protein
MFATVQQIIRPVGLSADNRNAIRAAVVLAMLVTKSLNPFAGPMSLAPPDNMTSLCGLPTIQRQINNASLINYLRNGSRLCFDRGGRESYGYTERHAAGSEHAQPRLCGDRRWRDFGLHYTFYWRSCRSGDRY